MFRTVTVFGCCLGVLNMSLAWGVLALLVVVPAWIRTELLREAQLARGFPPHTLGFFVSSLVDICLGGIVLVMIWALVFPAVNELGQLLGARGALQMRLSIGGSLTYTVLLFEIARRVRATAKRQRQFRCSRPLSATTTPWDG
jgi:hypothetical protein